MTEPTMLSPLTPDQSERAGAALGRAFEDDPLWAATFSDPARRPKLLFALFTALTKATLAAQGVAETTPDVAAVALWLPPGKDIRLGATVKSGFALPRLVMSLPAADRKRMMAVLGQFEERKKVLMPEPHWYLSAIGVEPDRQGHGLGSALVRTGMARADRENTPIYLETETEGNVSFYQHLGFKVIEQTNAIGLDLPVWLMVRRPPSRST